MSRAPISKSKNYTWHQIGDKENQPIAFIAPSNAWSQEVIKKRIDLLVAKGFCVICPLYKSDSEEYFLVDPREKHEEVERMRGSITPAVSEIDGANQIIEAIEAGIDIMPLMGGENFEKKIPHILEYFAKHPEGKNMAVRIFGLSNATFANYLAAQGICDFVSSPFLSVISDSDDGKKDYDAIAEALLKVMKRQSGEHVREFKVMEGEDEVRNISTKHYPLNIGPLIEAAEKKVIAEGFNPTGNYSIEFEGFIEIGSRRRILDIASIVRNFLKAHKDNPPQFMVCGIFSTRFDAAKGYNKLSHDEETLIALSDNNIEAIFAKRLDLKKDLAAAITDNTERRKVEFSPELTAKIQDQDYELTKEDIATVIKHENLQIRQLHEDLRGVAQEYKIPLLLSADFGHAANMGIVPCGDYICEVNEKNVSAYCDLTSRPAKDLHATKVVKAEDKGSQAVAKA